MRRFEFGVTSLCRIRTIAAVILFLLPVSGVAQQETIPNETATPLALATKEAPSPDISPSPNAAPSPDVSPTPNAAPSPDILPTPEPSPPITPTLTPDDEIPIPQTRYFFSDFPPNKASWRTKYVDLNLAFAFLGDYTFVGQDEVSRSQVGPQASIGDLRAGRIVFFGQFKTKRPIGYFLAADFNEFRTPGQRLFTLSLIHI